MKRTSAIMNRQWQWAVLGSVLLAFVILFPPYDGSFVGDDFVQFRYIWEYMDRPFTAFALLNPYALSWYYRPLQNWWFLTNRLLFGFNPFPYYAILSGFHALAICLIYRTSRQLHLSPLASFCAAALWAIHAHWVDVVGWLSSVAIVLAAVFNLAAVLSYLKYLRLKQQLDDGQAIRWLGLTAAFFLLALITHEEAFLLPILLLIIRRLELGNSSLNREAEQQSSRETAQHRNYVLRSSPYETILFAGMFLLTAVYLYTQATRPNLTLQASEVGLSGYLSHVQVAEIGRFIIDTFVHFTLYFTLPARLGNYTLLAAAVLIILLALCFWRGGPVVKLGLLWAGLHLGFIYFALWTQKPELFAGRHIYQAGIGFSWAIGAGIDWAERRWAKGDGRKAKSPRPLRSPAPPLLRAILLLLLTAVLLFQLQITRNTQASWLERAVRYRQAEAQVKELLPTVNANTTVFAHRFPITPGFLPATFQVWYETTINTAIGGGLPQLKQAGKATPNYYLFDYQNGEVVNLMPELQAHEETLFLWAEDGRVEQINAQAEVMPLLDVNSEITVAGPANDLRVALIPPPAETAGTWTSIIYPVVVPEDSQLQLSLYAEDEAAAFRVRLQSDGRTWATLLAPTVPTAGQWTDMTIPLQDYWGQSLILRLESTRHGLWGNPRFTVD